MFSAFWKRQIGNKDLTAETDDVFVDETTSSLIECTRAF
jgi:hypothetical protein